MIVLTNDDGIDAPGIWALRQAVAAPTVLVAPHQEVSGCGHRVTTQTPIRVERRSETDYAVAGTPADCTRLALHALIPQVEWVLSGINAGGNMGTDVYTSGTVAAVREAALHRIPAIALSYYRSTHADPFDWERASQIVAQILKTVMAQPPEPGTYWNINLPYLDPAAPDPELVICDLCTQPLPVSYENEADLYHYRGRYPQRNRDRGADTDICLSGRISATLLRL